MTLLLVEDDLTLARHLVVNLKDHGILTHHAKSQLELDENLQGPNEFDFVILDRLLGRFDSKNSLKNIKLKWPHAPLMVLSAVCTPNERTDLINLGADDYMGKPFSTQELIARIRALVRRTAPSSGNFIQVGNLTIDMIKRIVSVGSQMATLPSKEFILLQTLTSEPGRVWSRSDLLDYVWSMPATAESNVVESTIANLRKKLTELGSQVHIRNSRNAGYWVEG